MDYTESTRLSEILEAHPWLAEELPKRDPAFEKLRNPAARFLLRQMTVKDLGRIGGLSPEALLRDLEEILREREGGGREELGKNG